MTIIAEGECAPEVRPPAPRDIYQLPAIQARGWQLQGERDVIPPFILRASMPHGGLLLVAYCNGEPVGFVWGTLYPARSGKRLFYSHLLVVDKDHQNRGIGLALKKAQYMHLKRLGAHRAYWVYDPLQPRLLHLNIARLGTLSTIFYRDYYHGPGIQSKLFQLPTSPRLKAEWVIGSPRVEARLTDPSLGRRCAQAALENPDSHTLIDEAHSPEDILQSLQERLAEGYTLHEYLHEHSTHYLIYTRHPPSEVAAQPCLYTRES